jgi:murein DD-endopeptidase MepM/ murein hydrolase activator NlpD
MHEGLDIAANLGEPIYAALDGTVTYSGWASGYGNLIKLKHNDGIDTYYGHCSKLLVSEGQKVKKGEKIAEVGSTGNSTGPHLHFEIRINGVPKDPTKYLNDIKNK